MPLDGSRLKRLQRDGFVEGYGARLNPHRLGLGLLVFVEVLLDKTTPDVFERFARAVQTAPEVLECHMVAGGFDYLVKARVANMTAYRRFLGETLLALPGVRETRTYAVMEEVKRGAPLPVEVAKIFERRVGMKLKSGWGMTETCGASTGVPATGMRPGSIGPAAGFNEVRLDPVTSEILVRGKNVFAGYLNLPEKTAETIDADGWLHTGDVGVRDPDGYFRITDRMKDIIITAGGKNITPSELENELKFSPYVTDAVVIGDKRPYLTVIIMIDQENVEKFAQDYNIPFTNYASLCRAPEIQDLIKKEIETVNANFGTFFTEFFNAVLQHRVEIPHNH